MTRTDVTLKPPTFTSLTDLLHCRIQTTPDATAFVSYAADGEESAFSWRQFGALLAGAVELLQGMDLKAGDLALIAIPTCLNWEVYHHACLGLGVAVIGVDPRDRTACAGIMKQEEIAVLIALPEVIEGLEPSVREQLKGTIEITSPVSVGDDTETHEKPLPLRSPDPELPATIIYTSGTTGTPKGIVYTHGQLFQACGEIAAAYRSIGNGARFPCWLPLANLFQRVVNLWAMLSWGVIHIVENPARLMELMPRMEPDLLIGVPRFYEKLHGQAQRYSNQQPVKRELSRDSVATGNALGSRRNMVPIFGGRLQFMISGSAPMAAELIADFETMGIPLLEAYGVSENIVPMCLNTLDQRRLGSVGRPLPSNDIKIAQDQEILVRGPGVFAGYRGGHERDGCFTEDGYYRTGDLGRFDAQGYLHILGRKSEIFKTTTGRKIAPVKIENIIKKLLCVQQAVVVGASRKCLVALLDVESDMLPEQPDGTAWANLLKSELPNVLAELVPHERPAGFVILREPLSVQTGELTANLKIKRRAVLEKHAVALERLYAALDHQATGEILVVAE